MDKKIILLMVMLLAASFLPLPAKGVDFSVGVSPPLVDAGVIAPGEQKIIKFSIFTVSDESLLVYFGLANASMDYFQERYPDKVGQFSEEPTSSWLEFTTYPVEIDATKEKTMGRAWQDVTAILKVPQNAEPGYHLIHITPQPVVSGAAGAPVGTSIVATVSTTVVFLVKGDARRDGVILDTQAAAMAGGIGYDIIFQNTGTDTISAKTSLEVYGKDGKLSGIYSPPKEYIGPQAIHIYSISIPGALPRTEYVYHSNVNYTSGTAQRNESLSVSGAKVTAQATAEQQEFPVLPIVLILIIIAVLALLYRWLREKK